MSAQPTLPGVSSRRVIGRRERAAQRQITEWRELGYTIGPVTSSALRAAALAVDRAEQDHEQRETSALSVARAVAVWWTVYRDADPIPRAAAEYEPDELDDDLPELPAMPEL